MIKKLLKLEILILTLSLVFIGFSCSDDDDDDDTELLEGKVNYEGSYSATVTESENTLTINYSFEKGNKLRVISTMSSIKFETVYKVSEVTPTGNENEYKVKIDLIVEHVTPLTDEAVQALKTDEDTKDIDWHVNVTQDFTSRADSKDKSQVMIVSIKDNKNTMVQYWEKEPEDKITFTYKQ